jgi:hypothetical protein
MLVRDDAPNCNAWFSKMVGAAPDDQLPPVDHSLLTAPVQLCVEVCATATGDIPVPASRATVRAAG